MTRATADKAVSTAIKDLALRAGSDIGAFLTGLTELVKPADKPPVLVASKVLVSETQATAVDELLEAIEGFSFPETRRELSEIEKAKLGTLVAKVKNVKKLVENTEKQLRIAAFNDLDVAAERQGKVNEHTPRDKDGFYLLPGEGPGYAREVSAPTPGTDVAKLVEAVADGTLTHRDFLAATRPVRVLDAAGYLGLIARKPQLLPVLRRGITFSRRGSVSFKVK
jgi:hypothetical protein